MRKLIVILFGLLLVGCDKEVSTITDDITSPEMKKVTPMDHHFLVEWLSDAMDRGNHDFDTGTHGELVIDPKSAPLERGDVVYYKMFETAIKKNPEIPKNYLGRVVGLPGETIEIKDGHVYIDHKKLDTFYGVATIRGMEEEEYLDQADLSHVNDLAWVKSYFNFNLEPIKVDEETVFVLVDHWWRGTDSKDFGLLPMERIQGKVLGYSDEF